MISKSRAKTIRLATQSTPYSVSDSASRSITRSAVSSSSLSRPLPSADSQRYASLVMSSVTAEEHRRVLSRNETIAKENSSLKQHIRQLKREMIALQANQLTADAHANHKQTCEMIVSAIRVMSDVFAFMKHNVEDIDIEMERVSHVIDNCFETLRQSYPDHPMPDSSSQQFVNIDANQTDSCVSRNGSRFSMSGADRESRRVSILDKLKRDFRVFSELSTIVEASRELRSNSANFKSIMTCVSSANSKMSVQNSENSLRADFQSTSRQALALLDTSDKENIPPENRESIDIKLSPPQHSSSPYEKLSSNAIKEPKEIVRSDENGDYDEPIVADIELDVSLNQKSAPKKRSLRISSIINYDETVDEVDNTLDECKKKNKKGTKKGKAASKTRTSKRSKSAQNAKQETEVGEHSVYDFSDENSNMASLENISGILSNRSK